MFINPFAMHRSTALGSRDEDVDVCGGGGVILGADAALHTLKFSVATHTGQPGFRTFPSPQKGLQRL